MEEQLLEAIRYFEAGNKQDAQKQLALVLKNDPENEYAWLWMALTLEDDPVRKRACLEQVLTLDPQNSKANQMLRGMKEQNGRFSPPLPPVPAHQPPTATLVEISPIAISPPPQEGPIHWDTPFEEADEDEVEQTAVFATTINPYDQADELLDPNPDPREYQPESSSPPPSRRFNMRRLLIILGVVVFASALYAVSVLLLVKDDLLGTPTADNALVALLDPTATEETAVVEATAASAATNAAPTPIPTATQMPTVVAIAKDPTATPLPTAEPAPTETAVPTSQPSETPSNSTLTYLEAARDTTTPLQTALTQIIQLVAEVDFDNADWKTAMLTATQTISTTHAQIKLIVPPQEAQAAHDKLLATSDQCYAAITYLEEGTNNRDIEAMQPAASHLSNCRDGLEALNAIWNTLPIDVNTVTPETEEGSPNSEEQGSLTHLAIG